MPVNFQNLNYINNFLLKKKNTELLIVTKNRSFDEIQSLINHGYKNFGENRVQEANNKFSNQILDKYKIQLHLIGPLQTNKTNQAVKLFHTIQSLDRLKLAECLAKEIEKSDHVVTKNFYIQINIGNEKQKSGININQLKDFYQSCLDLKLNVVGLMCIPPNVDDPSEYFILMQKLKNDLNQNLLLSMGMSHDYKLAINSGTNMIRIGSKIFE